MKGFLAQLPEGEIFERHGFQRRLERAQARLVQLSLAGSPPEPLPIRLTFRGAPVEGTHTISADFAGRALSAFSDVVETIAASLTTALRDSGPIPGAGQRTLRIVRTALGSFGFDLELPPPSLELQQSSEFEDAHASALKSALDLIDEALRADDDQLAERIADIHPRAAAKVRAFIKVLDDADAGFAADFADTRVEVTSSDQVRRVLDALKSEDIREQTLEVEGTVTGVLPGSRRIECRLSDGRLIHGKLALTLVDPAAFKRTFEDRPAQLSFNEVIVRGRRRYTLRSAQLLDGFAAP